MLRRIIRFAAPLTVVTAIVGCSAAESDEGDAPADETGQTGTAESALRLELTQVGGMGSCQLRDHCGHWKPGKKYRGGGYTVCWMQTGGGCGWTGVFDYYGVWDHTGVTRRLKLDLHDNTDTHCHTINGYGYSKFEVDEDGLGDNSYPRALFSC